MTMVRWLLAACWFLHDVICIRWRKIINFMHARVDSPLYDTLPMPLTFDSFEKT